MLFKSVAACPRIVAPTTELALLPSHQFHVSAVVPMSVALCTPAMPPPFWTYLMIDAFWASDHSGPGGPAEAFRSTIASYLARFASVKMRGFLSALSQFVAPPPLLMQSSQSTVKPAVSRADWTTGR